MKKFLLLLIIPLFIFSQNKNDSIREFFSINVSSIDNTFGATSSTFYSNKGYGFFVKSTYEFGEVFGKEGKNYTYQKGAMINYFANNESSNYNYIGLYNGRSVSYLIGSHFPIISNLYLSPGIGFSFFPERAQYNSDDFGGDFYYRTKFNTDLVGTLSLSTIIMKRFFFQFGFDILPDKEKSDYINNNTFKRIKNNALFSYNFSIGFLFGTYKN